MLQKDHVVITDFRVDQSLIGKLLNRVNYTLVRGNGATRQIISHAQPFEFEVFTNRIFEADKVPDLTQELIAEYTHNLQTRIESIRGNSKSDCATKETLDLVARTLDERVRIVETRSHKFGVIAPSYSFEPVRTSIGAFNLIPKTTQVKNAFRSPLTLAYFDGKELRPTSIPLLDNYDIQSDLGILDIETTNYDFKELTEKEKHSHLEDLQSLYDEECKKRQKKAKKNLTKSELIAQIHLLRNDGKRKRLSGTMVGTPRKDYIITELTVPSDPTIHLDFEIITTKKPAKVTNEIFEREKPLFLAHHYGLAFDNPEFDDLAGTNHTRFSHNTKGGSTSVYKRRTSIDIDTFGARHLPGILNGKLATLFSVYTARKVTKPLTHAELEKNIQAAMQGDAHALQAVLNYMRFDITTQRELTRIVAKPLLHLTDIFETTTESLASSDPSTIIKSFVERKFERLNDTTFFPKYMWNLKREIEDTNIQREIQRQTPLSHPLQPGKYHAKLIWCHPQIGAIAPQGKPPRITELFRRVQEETHPIIKQLYTTFAQQYAEYYIMHARIMSTNSFSYAFDKPKSDYLKILQNYANNTQAVGHVVREAIAFNGSLALVDPRTDVPNNYTFTTIGEGDFFVLDPQTFIGEVNGAIRKANTADPSSKSGIKSKREQGILHDFFSEYFTSPHEALIQLNRDICAVQEEIATNNIANLCVKKGGRVIRDTSDQIRHDLFATTKNCYPLGTLARVAYLAGIRGPHLHDFLTRPVTPQPVTVTRGIQTELF